MGVGETEKAGVLAGAIGGKAKDQDLVRVAGVEFPAEGRPLDRVRDISDGIGYVETPPIAIRCLPFAQVDDQIAEGVKSAHVMDIEPVRVDPAAPEGVFAHTDKLLGRPP